MINVILTTLISFAINLPGNGPTVNALDWTPGDSAAYNLTIGGFIKGTMDSSIRSAEPNGYYWVDQVADLGFAGKQNIEVLINPATGDIKKLIVNGQEQDPPVQEDFQVIEMKEASITVPAGTFDAVYIKTKNDSGNVNETWLNNDVVPVFGLVKQIAPTQMGNLDMELTSYHKN